MKNKENHKVNPEWVNATHSIWFVGLNTLDQHLRNEEKNNLLYPPDWNLIREKQKKERENEVH